MSYLIKWTHGSQTISADFKYSANDVSKSVQFNEPGTNGCYLDPDYREELYRIQQGYYFVRRLEIPPQPGWTLFLESSRCREKTTVPAAAAWQNGQVFTIQDGSPALARTSGVIMVSNSLRTNLIALLSDVQGLLKLQVTECTVPDHMKGSEIAQDFRPYRIRWSVPVKRTP